MSTIQKFLLAFVTIIVGVILLTIVATSANSSSSTFTAQNETLIVPRNATTQTTLTTAQVNLTNNNLGSDSWKNDPTTVPECAISNFVLRNQTGQTQAASAYTLNAATGTLTLANVLGLNQSASTTAAVDYTYCPDTYISSSFGRSTMQLLGGFFALALLGVGLGLFMSIGRDLDLW